MSTDGLSVRKERGKLAPLFIGPYEVAERVGLNDYRLKLPVGMGIHPVFHVRLLKGWVPPLVVGRSSEAAVERQQEAEEVQEPEGDVMEVD